MQNAHANSTESIVLGGGCFWCVEAVYERVRGVVAVTSGYAGGEKPDPAYREVCEGTTGHAEVVQVDFRPDEVTLDELLEIFWQAHNPTSLNRQGADIGTQYRSVVFYNSEAQKETAEASIAKAQENFDRPIVTEVRPLETFYPAEDYHQGYYRANSSAPYCFAVIHPKLRKLEEHGAIPAD